MQSVKVNCETKIEHSGKSKTLTVTKLRKYKDLQNLTETEAKQAVEAIEKLSILLFHLMKNDEIIRYEDDSIN